MSPIITLLGGEFEEIKTRSKISLDELIDRVIKDVGIERNELILSRRGQKVSYARAVISYLAVNQLGRSASDVARKLGMSGWVLVSVCRGVIKFSCAVKFGLASI